MPTVLILFALVIVIGIAAAYTATLSVNKSGTVSALLILGQKEQPSAKPVVVRKKTLWEIKKTQSKRRERAAQRKHLANGRSKSTNALRARALALRTRTGAFKP